MRGSRTVLTAALAATVLVVAGAASGTASSTPSGLVAAYSFDEGAGSSVADASGNGNTGTTGTASWSAGRFGSALAFDGPGDVVTIADSPLLDLTNAMTLEAWVKPAVAASWSTVLVKERGSGLTYALRANSSTPELSAEAYVGNPRMARSVAPLPLNAWTHLAATFDGEALRLFVNGVQVSARTAGGVLAVTSGALRIGGTGYSGESFRGSIDEVRIYDRALSAAELAADMDTRVVVPDTTPPTSPASLRVTEATATSVALAWDASIDDGGVAGYGLSRDGNAVETTTLTSHTFASLACGTTYVFALDAFDAAGNRSTPASLSASTSTCPPPPAQLYVSPSGSDLSLCTELEPCASLDRAYDLALPGDVVELAGGTYPVQIVDGTKAAPRVLFRPAAGANVSLAELGVRADQLELRDLAVPGGVAVRSESDFATLRNLDLGGRLYIAGPRDLTIVGGDVGPFVDGPSWITHDDGVAPERVLIEGVRFHDFTVSGPWVHSECMLVVAGDGIVLRGNTWTNCAVFDLSFGFCCSSPAPPTNVLIENNFFGRPSNGSTTTLHFNSNLDPVGGYTIRNNSSDGAFVLDQGQVTFSNVTAVGNALAGSGCGRILWSHNVFTGSSCDGVGNALVADLGFVDAAAGDLHRTAMSPLADAGSPTDYPRYDYDGEPRPLGAAPDAGADESG